MRPVGNLACGDSSHGRLGAPAVRLTPGAMSIWRGAPRTDPSREAGSPCGVPRNDPSRETGSPLPAPSQGAHRVQSQSSPCRVGHRVTRGHCFCLRAGGPFFPRAGGLQRGHCPFDFGHEKKGEQERRETPYTGSSATLPLPHKDVRRRPTLPHPPECSTIGAVELSYRVRNGTGRFLDAMTTVTLRGNQPPTPHTPGRPGLLLQNHTVDANTSKQTSVD